MILMPKNANNFIRNRKTVNAITSIRINQIVWYVIECYKKLLKDSPIYSKAYVEKGTAFHFEDYLKMDLVDSYLIPNKEICVNKFSELEGINFHYEVQKRFTDSVGKERVDKIDIYINKFGLQNSWKEQDENVYYVFECKRIELLSDCADYLGDTQNFVDRNYTNLRLPFEGQIAFIESNKINHTSVSVEINKRLKTKTSIKTKQELVIERIHSSFNGSYKSIHTRNYGKNEDFKIIHLLFEYSNLISD
jgi:hypothetical protein